MDYTSTRCQKTEKIYSLQLNFIPSCLSLFLSCWQAYYCISNSTKHSGERFHHRYIALYFNAIHVGLFSSSHISPVLCKSLGTPFHLWIITEMWHNPLKGPWLVTFSVQQHISPKVTPHFLHVLNVFLTLSTSHVVLPETILTVLSSPML